jgi:tripartite-type tricarboxylate transporter receptor subunit TctC
MQRRDFLKGAAALPFLGHAQSAFADTYPTHNVSMVVPFPPGGQADLAARPIAQKLQELMGKPFVVDNRGGAGGGIGNAYAARSTPDGYTLLMTLSSLAVLPEADRILGRPAQYEVSQLTPIARVLADPTLLGVTASAPWKNVQELVEDAKAHPGSIPYGSSGSYGTLHVSMAMFETAAGIKMLHIPYKGAGPAVTDLLSGQIKALASAPGVLKPHVDSGAVRVLANFGAKRVATFPNLPTFQELGYKDVELYIWAGLFAPAKTPETIVTQLRVAMKKAMADPQTTKIFETAGSPPAYLDAPEFQKFIDEDSARLITAVKKIGKVE